MLNYFTQTVILSVKGHINMLKLYENIKKNRLQLRMSQKELAKRTGYTDRSMITKIEKGRVDLPLSKIILFADVLQTTPIELMGLSDDDLMEESTIYHSMDSFNPDEIRMLEVYHKSSPETQQIIRLLLAKEQGIPAIAEQERPVADNTDNESSRIKDK
mgnify:FL=1